MGGIKIKVIESKFDSVLMWIIFLMFVDIVKVSREDKSYENIIILIIKVKFENVKIFK